MGENQVIANSGNATTIPIYDTGDVAWTVMASALVWLMVPGTEIESYLLNSLACKLCN